MKFTVNITLTEELVKSNQKFISEIEQVDMSSVRVGEGRSDFIGDEVGTRVKDVNLLIALNELKMSSN